MCTITKNYESCYSLTTEHLVMIVDIYIFKPSDIKYYLQYVAIYCMCNSENVSNIDIAYSNIA